MTRLQNVGSQLRNSRRRRYAADGSAQVLGGTVAQRLLPRASVITLEPKKLEKAFVQMLGWPNDVTYMS